MTIKESIEIFGKDAVIETITDMLRSYQQDLEWLETEAEFIFREYLKSPGKHTYKMKHGAVEFDAVWDWDDFFKARIESNKQAERRLRKILNKWRVKAKIINGELNEDRILVDLDAIKQIPITQFLPEPTMRGNKKNHYKAPWRNETQGSLVVFTDENRFHDFGDSDKRGSVIDFIMLTEGLDFKGAVNYLKNYL